MVPAQRADNNIVIEENVTNNLHKIECVNFGRVVTRRRQQRQHYIRLSASTFRGITNLSRSSFNDNIKFAILYMEYNNKYYYIVHGSKNRNDTNSLWGEFAETNERHFDLLLQIFITHWLSVA